MTMTNDTAKLLAGLKLYMTAGAYSLALEQAELAKASTKNRKLVAQLDTQIAWIKTRL
jgi:hypothetical protein